MVNMQLYGPIRGHHKFTVPSMISRRAGRTWHVTLGHAGATAKPGSAAVFVVMRRLLGMVMRDLYLA
jgi:hypothetical protein